MWRKPLISIALAAHVLFIGLQNLPTREKLWAVQKSYIALSGQFQGWIMFANLSTQSNRIEILARAPGGAISEPFGPSKAWPTPFLDAMMDASKAEKTADAVLTALRERLPSDARPAELRFRLLRKPLPGPGQPGVPGTFAVAREFSRRW